MGETLSAKRHRVLGRKEFLECSDCGLDILLIDIKVGHEPELALPLDEYTSLLKEFGQRMRISVSHVDINHIGLNVRHVNPIDITKPPGQGYGIRVVLGEPFDMVLECVEAGRCDNAGLAHPAPQGFSPTARFGDEILVSTEQCAHWCTEPLGQAERNGVEVPGDVCDGNAERDRRIEYPCPIQV